MPLLVLELPRTGDQSPSTTRVNDGFVGCIRSPWQARAGISTPDEQGQSKIRCRE